MGVSTRRRPDRPGKWQVVISWLDPETGKTVWRTEEANSSKEAKDLAALWRRKLKTGTQTARNKVTVQDVLDAWVRATLPGRKHGTQVIYKYAVSHYIAPALGAGEVQKLTPDEVSRWVAGLLDRGIAPRTAGQALQVLRRALALALSWGQVERNVAALVPAPRPGRERVWSVWTEEEAARFLDLAERESRHPALWRLALVTGMRKGELLGLRWSALDLDNGTLEVREQAIRVDGKGLEPDSPKGGRSRAVLLDAETVRALRDQKGRLAVQRAAQPSWQDRDLVFPSEIGTYWSLSSLRYEWVRLIKEAEVPYIRMHDTRHTSASWAINDGVGLKTISERLGHADIKTTAMMYTHISTATHQAAADLLGAKLPPRKDPT